jgi:hypothetical protein
LQSFLFRVELLSYRHSATLTLLHQVRGKSAIALERGYVP